MSEYSISSAAFNVRSIVKQMLLLEDHLTDDDKFCVDCIRKHFLMIEALAEEAVTMDPTSVWVPTVKDIYKDTRQWFGSFEGGGDRIIISQLIREKRKDLIVQVFDYNS